MLLTLLLACHSTPSAHADKSALVCYEGGALTFASETTVDEMGGLIASRAAAVEQWKVDHQRWIETQPRNQTVAERAQCIKLILYLASRETSTGTSSRNPQQECLPYPGNGEVLPEPKFPDPVEPEDHRELGWRFRDHGVDVVAHGSCVYRHSVTD